MQCAQLVDAELQSGGGVYGERNEWDDRHGIDCDRGYWRCVWEVECVERDVLGKWWQGWRTLELRLDVVE